MNVEKFLKAIAQIALAFVLLYCFYNVNEQRVIINDLKEEVKKHVDNDERQEKTFKDLVNFLKEMSELCEKQSIANALLMAELDKAEYVKPTDLTPMKNRVDAILSQIEQLEKDKITQNDFDKWIKNVEKLVDNSLIELSKPSTVPPIKPMPNIDVKPSVVALSNQEKEELVKKVKGEIYKQLEHNGYGKFEDGEFILKKGFFGAIIDPSELESYHSISPYVDDSK